MYIQQVAARGKRQFHGALGALPEPRALEEKSHCHLMPLHGVLLPSTYGIQFMDPIHMGTQAHMGKDTVPCALNTCGTSQRKPAISIPASPLSSLQSAH